MTAYLSYFLTLPFFFFSAIAFFFCEGVSSFMVVGVSLVTLLVGLNILPFFPS